MRSQSRPLPSLIVTVALAAGLTVAAAAQPPRHRPAGRHVEAPSAAQMNMQIAAPHQPGAAGYIGSGEDGQSMVHAPQQQAGANGFIGGTDDGQSIRRRQPRHRGGNHSHHSR